MGRRKKTSETTHRETIASAAESLFLQRGIESTTMDDLAKEAGYSKATLYVYFANKEEILAFLILKSMKLLYSLIQTAISCPGTIKEKYDCICHALVEYQEQYPLYFTFAIGEIHLNFHKKNFMPIEKEIYEVGEQINQEIIQFLHSGMESKVFLPNLPVLQTVFLFWASLSGLIQMAAKKQNYIETAMGQSKEQFLAFGFHKLYGMIAREEAE